MSAPQSTINICSGVRLNSRYEHSIYFASASAQLAYFAGKVVKSYTAYTFLRKSWPLKVEATMEQAKTWNYLYFQNSASGKVYYYFINNVEYVNDSTVELALELDVLQTYFFDYSLLTSFVERQHVEDDTVGLHTLDEGLELGEFIVNKTEDATNLNDLCILVLSSVNVNGTTEETVYNTFSYVYNNVFSGLTVYAVDMEESWQEWGDQLDTLSGLGKVDGIVSMWMYPKYLVALGGEGYWGDEQLAKVVRGVENATKTIDGRPSTVDGYTPKNNKLLCYPYNFLYVTNNNGGGAAFRYERFANPNRLVFDLVGALSPDAGVKAYPRNYNRTDGVSEAAFDEGLSIGAYPTCSWDADTYKIWMAQNQNTHAVAAGSGALAVAAGVGTAIASAAMGNVMGAVGGLGSAVGGGMQIANLVAAQKDAEIQPPQSRGTYSANINISQDKQTFSFLYKSVRAEYAEIIDKYFTMYGYKVNKYKVPNIHAREAFTYVKTVGCHIKGNLCNEDTTKIESIFDSGITFWTSGDNVCNYAQSNNPL